MNLTEFAKHIGVSQPLVSKWVRQSILKKSVKKIGRQYEINAKIAKQELKKNRDPIRGGDRTGKNKKPIESEQKKTEQHSGTRGIDFNTARALNEQYKAALKKLQYEREHKILINVDEVKRIGFEAGKQIKEGCLSIPDRCAPLVAACSDSFECKKILLKEISYILENLSNALAVIK